MFITILWSLFTNSGVFLGVTSYYISMYYMMAILIIVATCHGMMEGDYHDRWNRDILWQANIAMENSLFIDNLPVNKWWYSRGMFVYWSAFHTLELSIKHIHEFPKDFPPSHGKIVCIWSHTTPRARHRRSTSPGTAPPPLDLPFPLPQAAMARWAEVLGGCGLFGG